MNASTQALIRRIQAITIAWMAVEVFVSLWSAWKASSPALAAFGGDSAIELLSAVVVIGRFQDGGSEHQERIAARLTASLLLLLAVFVVSISAALCFATVCHNQVFQESQCWPLHS